MHEPITRPGDLVPSDELFVLFAMLNSVSSSRFAGEIGGNGICMLNTPWWECHGSLR